MARISRIRLDRDVAARRNYQLKVAKQLNPLDEPQLLNELRAANQRVGLLINFGKEKVEFIRMVN